MHNHIKIKTTNHSNNSLTQQSSNPEERNKFHILKTKLTIGKQRDFTKVPPHITAIRGTPSLSQILLPSFRILNHILQSCNIGGRVLQQIRTRFLLQIPHFSPPKFSVFCLSFPISTRPTNKTTKQAQTHLGND